MYVTQPIQIKLITNYKTANKINNYKIIKLKNKIIIIIIGAAVSNKVSNIPASKNT